MKKIIFALIFLMGCVHNSVGTNNNPCYPNYTCEDGAVCLKWSKPHFVNNEQASNDFSICAWKEYLQIREYKAEPIFYKPNK